MTDERSTPRRAFLPSQREAQIRAEERRERFYDIVVRTIRDLPPHIQERLDNLDILVLDWPTPAQLARTDTRSRSGLLGLYEGIPHTKRGRGYGLVLPDKITIFRKPIESHCRTWPEIEKEIGRVVRHEIAHHFGFDEHELRTLENRDHRQ